MIAIIRFAHTLIGTPNKVLSYHTSKKQRLKTLKESPIQPVHGLQTNLRCISFSSRKVIIQDQFRTSMGSGHLSPRKRVVFPNKWSGSPIISGFIIKQNTLSIEARSKQH